MIHKMNLWNDSFEAINEGWKTIEIRLNDDKIARKMGRNPHFFVIFDLFLGVPF